MRFLVGNMPDIMSLMMVAVGAMMMVSMQRSESWNIWLETGLTFAQALAAYPKRYGTEDIYISTRQVRPS